MCSRVRASMNSDAKASVETGTVDPGFVDTRKVVADSRAYTAGGCCERDIRLSVSSISWLVILPYFLCR